MQPLKIVYHLALPVSYFQFIQSSSARVVSAGWHFDVAIEDVH